jgi:hypothetical protein
MDQMRRGLEAFYESFFQSMCILLLQFESSVHSKTLYPHTNFGHRILQCWQKSSSKEVSFPKHMGHSNGFNCPNAGTVYSEDANTPMCAPSELTSTYTI